LPRPGIWPMRSKFLVKKPYWQHFTTDVSREVLRPKSGLRMTNRREPMVNKHKCEHIKKAQAEPVP